MDLRFFAGGSASVRGWRVRELGNVSNPALGGNVLIEANFEYRIIFRRSFGGVVFVDLGNLWDDLRYVKLNQFAVACSFGWGEGSSEKKFPWHSRSVDEKSDTACK